MVRISDRYSTSLGVVNLAQLGPDMEMCHFPRLASNNSANGHWKRDCVVIGLDVTVDQVQSFCASYDISPVTLFGTAWALTLSHYVGDNRVGFVLKSDVTLTSTMVFAMDKGTSILELLKVIQARHMRDLPRKANRLADIPGFFDAANRPLFNTSISVQQQQSGKAVIIASPSDQAAEDSQQVKKRAFSSGMSKHGRD